MQSATADLSEENHEDAATMSPTSAHQNEVEEMDLLDED